MVNLNMEVLNKNEKIVNNHISKHDNTRNNPNITTLITKKITKLDFSGLKSVTEKIAIKTERYFNFIKRIQGFIYKYSILRGSSINWDKERLVNGKHEQFEKIGAKKLELTSKTTCKVDAHYFSTDSFMKKIEEMGGKRMNFNFETNPLLNLGKKCQIDANGVKIDIIKINLPLEYQELDNKILIISEYYKNILNENVNIYKRNENEFFIVKTKDTMSLFKNKLINYDENFNNLIKSDVKIDVLSKTEELLINTEQSFPGIKFEKTTNHKEIKKLFNELKLDKSSWSIVESQNAIYIAPKQHIGKLYLALKSKYGSTIEESEIKPTTSQTSNGVVLLTMNQSDIYEQYPHEMLTFILEGVDVMMYNNPGKGLSTGYPDKENINASIEACHDYLKHMGIPDEKILAKGQCFGAAPTAWLGKQHPKINLMLDQNPANFVDVVLAQIEETSNELSSPERNIFLRMLGKLLKDNFIINGLARAIFSGYNTPDDLRCNKGHKLFHQNVEINGFGGDALVPDHHLGLMLSHLSENTDNDVTISMNPGGTHVTDWWLSPESKESVMAFLKRNQFAVSLFESEKSS